MRGQIACGHRRGGAVYVLVVVAMVALLGMAAFSVDLGRVVLAAQRAQQVADAAALAGVAEKIYLDQAGALVRAGDVIEANNDGDPATVTWDPQQTVFHRPGDTIAGYGALQPFEDGMTVTTQVVVSYFLARVFGLESTTVTRRATAVRVYSAGTPICPMWVAHGTDYKYGQWQELLMASGPHYADIPGSFGWLEPVTGSNDFLELLRGYNIPPEKIEGNWVEVGDIMTAYTGLSVGQWRAALERSNDGLARLERAQWVPWNQDTFDGSYHRTNPRLLIIPLCRYLGGTGTGAQFEIMAFGVFWLESVRATGNASISGRFIDYSTPGGGDNPLIDFAGLWTARLVG